ncbi:GRB2-associated-binding protein 1-like isoform X2 [Stegodyphus dumicola]|uniref:GRB2-associated-binding protein 1-like isoform X2 n=1 Tax=Stegodyphus dumicola TaxID=202533 RepID=UPI0015B204A3|nr:GRB2-associated-binding protein 1-like isoform X2 [Stegodyphus dumicola]
MEGVVHDGWLVKSPPEKRIFKAKWRQRWFVLRHSGLLPGQFVLEYFTDNMCKKLKGRIDLDQCEQVDAGLTFESKKTSYQYMFDIRTRKRTYYLVAETEAEMNKWVECICSVCGLKIHIEEDFLVPQDSANNNVINSTTGSVASNLTEVKSSSNPYIPISECHTGKPVLNGSLPNVDACGDLPKEPPPPPPPTKIDWNPIDHPIIPDEFYDYPKPLNQGKIDMQHMPLNVVSDDTYKVPLNLKSDFENNHNSDLFKTLPPKVNWNSYPDENVSQNSSTIPRRKSNVKCELAEYDVVPSFHGSIKEIKLQPRKVQTLANHFESMSLNSVADTHASSQKSNSNQVSEISDIPPRPPKPSKLRERHRYENFELPHQIHREEDKSAYDVPPASKEVTCIKQNSQPLNLLKNESGDDLSPSTKVPLSSSASKESYMDDTYDFPKFRNEESNINTAVPPPQNTGTSQRPRRHAYTNAPPGLFNSKDLIFNYEYRPSLMTDGYLSGDTVKNMHTGSDAVTPPSPSAIGAYANVPTSPTLATNFQNDLPPAVNRELKPKKVLSNEDRGSFSFLTLQPPPVCRSRTKANKRSFRKPRAAPNPTPGGSLNGMPPVPNRFRHHPEMSATSDDEMSNSSGSRRNSSNDDQTRHLFPVPSKKEIQYLDLDLDSEPSPSPKSPERVSESTVYKKVDFVKTKAFNEMRQNVEESYRKSQ